MRFAPEIEGIKRAMLLRIPAGSGDELRHGLAHAGMIYAEAGRCLRADRLTLIGDKARVFVSFAQPLGRRVDVELHDDSQTRFVGKAQELFESFEMVFAF